MDDLFFALEDWCAESYLPVVLIVDEVDSATNNQVFLGFLAQLRAQYLERAKRGDYPAFQSVILAGVTDVMHLKAKIRPEDEHRTNSPWNIAAPFDVDMSFSVADVVGMLRDYESDHATDMNVDVVASELVAWTGGYPYLVSRLCQLVDERPLRWDRGGVGEAVRILLAERNPLFSSLTDKLAAFPSLGRTLRCNLMEGRTVTYNPDQDDIAVLETGGFVKDDCGNLAVANRVFETRLYNLFLSEDEVLNGRLRDAGSLGRSRFVRDGHLDMREVLEGFRRTFTEIFGPLVDRFPERVGREQFLFYLKPIINGTGNYYIEAQTRDHTRMDVVVDYLGERFVVELKVWRGPRYNEEGERQLVGYLDHFDLEVGYMVSFNFNRHKDPGLRRVDVDGRVIWEETL